MNRCHENPSPAILSLRQAMTMFTINRRRLLMLPGLLVVSASAAAHSLRLGDIAIGHAWSLPTPLSDGQAFFPLVNQGTKPDALIAARCDICPVIELRTNARYDHPAAESFILEPGKPVPIRPQARHLRLMGLRAPLLMGERFSVVLDFEQAGEVEVEVFVEAAPGT
jgi:periplasmic copper chaperone A